MNQLATPHEERQVNAKGKRMLTIVIATGVLRIVSGWAIAEQDKYTLKVPNGLAFSEFRGYEAWQVVSISRTGNSMAAILANPVTIEAYLPRLM